MPYAPPKPRRETELIDHLIRHLLPELDEAGVAAVLAKRVKPQESELPSVLTQPEADVAVQDLVHEGEQDDFRETIVKARRSTAKLKADAWTSASSS